MNVGLGSDKAKLFIYLKCCLHVFQAVQFYCIVTHFFSNFTYPSSKIFSNTVTTIFRLDIQSLHFTYVMFYWTQCHTADCFFQLIFGKQDAPLRFGILSWQSSDLSIELLKSKIDSNATGIFKKDISDRFNFIRIFRFHYLSCYFL